MKLNGNNVKYLTFNIFNNIIAVHSTRLGGVSQGHHASMNLGFARGDKAELVHENYKLFSEAIGVDNNRLVLSDQWHHNNILIVDESHLGMGIHKERSYSDIDGLVTDKKNIPLVTFYADCVPIYFHDPVQEVIGMVHAGWRGTSTAIVKDMIELMKTQYNSSEKDILIGIGPAVCKSCYQVTEEVIDSMQFNFDIKTFYDFNEQENRYYIDLKAINKAIALEAGIEEVHIEVTDLCTKCRPDLFFSHRRHGNERGTQIGVMMMEE